MNSVQVFLQKASHLHVFALGSQSKITQFTEWSGGVNNFV